MASTTCTSTRISRVSPTGTTVRFSSTRSSVRLGAQAQLGDLVQEQHAAVRRAEEAGLVGDGAGERALAMAEEAGRRQLVGDLGAVDGHEGLLRGAPL